MSGGELHFDIELVTKDNASDKPIRIAGTGIFFTVTLVECGHLLLRVSLAGAISTLFDFHCRFLTWPSALTEFYRQLLDSLCLLMNRIKALYLLVGNQSPCLSIRLYLSSLDACLFLSLSPSSFYTISIGKNLRLISSYPKDISSKHVPTYRVKFFIAKSPHYQVFDSKTGHYRKE